MSMFTTVVKQGNIYLSIVSLYQKVATIKQYNKCSLVSSFSFFNYWGTMYALQIFAYCNLQTVNIVYLLSHS